MKYIIAIVVALGLGMAAPSQASIIGSINGRDADLFKSANVLINLFEYQGDAVTSLNATITGAGTPIIKSGSTLTYWADTGIYQTTVGSSAEPKLLKKLSNVEITIGHKPRLVISDLAKKNAASYIYNYTTNKVSKFSPTVGAITAADMTADGKTLVMVAKNPAGKVKLFVSQGNAATVKAFDLPLKASTCTSVAISTTAKQVALGCTIGTDSNNLITATFSGYKLTSINTQTDANYSNDATIWLNDTMLAVGQSASLNQADNPFATKERFAVMTVTKGKITKVKNFTPTFTAMQPAGTLLHGITQMERVSDNQVLFTYLASGTTDPNDQNTTFFDQALASFNTSSGKTAILINNQTLNVLAD